MHSFKKMFWAVAFLLILTLPGFYFSIKQPKVNPNITGNFLKLPIYFEENMGQTTSAVKYLTKGKDYAFYFTSKEIVITLGKTPLKMQFNDSNPDVVVNGFDEQECKVNYFRGQDPKKWVKNIPTFSKVGYQNLYPGIDAIFYGNGKQLEYDFHIAPGANPNLAKINIEGAKELSIDSKGNLNIITDTSTLQMQKPIVYQMQGEEKISTEGHFNLISQNEIGFTVGKYDETKTLIIDPGLVYSTLLGGTDVDAGNGIAVDSEGNVYVSGITASTNFPTTPGCFQDTYAGGESDAFVTKLNPLGTALIYSTYIGGINSDTPFTLSLATDASGNVYIAGSTNSNNFPLENPYQGTLLGLRNAFVAKLNSLGSALIYSTYLGGNKEDSATNLTVDNTGCAYVTGSTTSLDFPTTLGSYKTTLQGDQSAFVTKLNPDGGSLVYSTYLGGTTGTFSDVDTTGYGIAVDNSGNAYIGGVTSANDFPTTEEVIQNIYGGGDSDGFVTKLNPAGNDLVYSTYLGGSSGDVILGISIDNSNNVYVVGSTQSTNFPVTTDCFQPNLKGDSNIIVTKINPLGTELIYSTLIGGNNDSVGYAISIDSSGYAYITGVTDSINFPITSDSFQRIFAGNFDAFFTKVSPDGKSLNYSTYLGGNAEDLSLDIAIDNSGNTYITGATGSFNFPLTPGSFQTKLLGEADAFIVKFGEITIFPPSNPAGFKTENRFLTQTDYINVLTWNPPAIGSMDIANYLIYRDASLTDLAGTVKSDRLQFKDHNREKNKSYTYYIVARDMNGNKSSPAILTINP